ncbi:hypothetical protein FB45DRAFT_874426 [Roridomyces roridus]|uniref:Uncharacterized protein n=1 Tax=Roridomyces roridus TaxID=1738132 RepID=A0AAD7B8N3_9AGAR|nr:hypothetical protein FB45DRAFT_874426 [Roridomyces roridus]
MIALRSQVFAQIYCLSVAIMSTAAMGGQIREHPLRQDRGRHVVAVGFDETASLRLPSCATRFCKQLPFLDVIGGRPRGFVGAEDLRVEKLNWDRMIYEFSHKS